MSVFSSFGVYCKILYQTFTSLEKNASGIHHIMERSDVLVFDHGVHYTFEQRADFLSEMTEDQQELNIRHWWWRSCFPDHCRHEAHVFHCQRETDSKTFIHLMVVESQKSTQKESTK